MINTDNRGGWWRFIALSNDGTIIGASEPIYPTQKLAQQHGELFYAQAMEGIRIKQAKRKTHLEK